MRLEFRLLVVDDAPESIQPAILALRDHLVAEGFGLVRTMWSGLLGEEARSFDGEQWGQFDLVMVDHDLRSSEDGAGVVEDLREKMKYTEMVFYSITQTGVLYDKLVKRKVQGVFVAQRDGLARVLPELADVVIGKATDLTHARGLAMAEVSDIEELMKGTIQEVLDNIENPCVESEVARVAKDLARDRVKDVKKLRVSICEDGLRGVLDSRLFDLSRKWRTILALGGCLPKEEVPEPMAIVKGFGKIIGSRNRLGHDPERSEDGLQVLGSRTTGSQEVIRIDDAWIRKFRKDLRMHRDAIEEVCRAIVGNFGGGSGVRQKGEKAKT